MYALQFVNGLNGLNGLDGLNGLNGLSGHSFNTCSVAVRPSSVYTFKLKDGKDTDVILEWKSDNNALCFLDKKYDCQSNVEDNLSPEYFKLSKDFIASGLINDENARVIKDFVNKVMRIIDISVYNSTFTMFIVDVFDKWPYIIKNPSICKRDVGMQLLANNINDYVWAMTETECGMLSDAHDMEKLFTSFVRSQMDHKLNIPANFDFAYYTGIFSNIVKFMVSKSILPIPSNSSFTKEVLKNSNITPLTNTHPISDDVYVAIKLLSRVIKMRFNANIDMPSVTSCKDRWCTPPRRINRVAMAPDTPEKPY